MAVRTFNGSTDFVRTSIGGLSAATYGTYAAIFKVDDTAVARSLFVFLDSGQSFLWHPYQVSNSDLMVFHGNTDSRTAAIPQGVWVTMVVRKVTGSALPRFSHYNHNTTTWTHQLGDATSGDGTAPTSGFINTATDGSASEPWDGAIAVTAGWSNTVVWSADTTGDAQIEAAGLEVSLQNWVDQSPDMLIPWNPTVGAGIADISGNGANQVAISGTTQTVGDDPPGFSFELGAEVPSWPRVQIVAG
jgi:hypothetical protein